MIQLTLADAQTLGGAFQQLIVCQKFQALLQREDFGADQTDGIVGEGLDPPKGFSWEKLLPQVTDEGMSHKLQTDKETGSTLIRQKSKIFATFPQGKALFL